MPSSNSVEAREGAAADAVSADLVSPRISRTLLLIASLAVLGNCLLTSPQAFSDRHQKDSGLLKLLVSALALTGPSGERGAFPTLRGVEIRDLFFYGGAALLLLTAGVHLLTRRTPPRISTDYFFDLRSRAASPFAWLVLMVFISLVTSAFSHAPDVSAGLVVTRFLHLAWWWPLAVLLRPEDARRLACVMVAAIAVTAGVGLWYHMERVLPYIPHARLDYPIGNPTWFGAMLLPVPFVAAGFLARRLAARRRPDAAGPGMAAMAAWLLTILLASAAIYLTHARAAQAGLVAGAFIAAFLLAPRRVRMVLVLGGLVLAAYGAHRMFEAAQHGTMGQRAHSIRSRTYEWSYALRLFRQKPVGGHGEGCYSMLAGQFAREDQLRDPSVMASDERAWTANAHNEYLELLADIGVAGALGFVLALGTTLFWAVRRCDAARAGQGGRAPPYDWLPVVGLSAGLAALMVEEAASVGLRQPGLPALFYTTWACLWALVRGVRPRHHVAEEDADRRLPVGAMRLFGGGCVAGSLVLFYFAVNDWRAARAAYEANALSREGQYVEAATHADFAAQHLLDPTRLLLARLEAVRARAFEFNRIVNRSHDGPSLRDIEIAQNAMALLDRLKQAAPRFLGVSRLEWMLMRDRATAHASLGEPANAAEFDDRALAALERNRDEEPFDVGLIEMLWYDQRMAAARQRRWQRSPNASIVARHLRERLGWIQALLRRHGVDDQVADLIRSFAEVPQSMDLIGALLSVAQRDAAAGPADWQDPLSPEMFRIAAAIADWSDKPQDAARLAGQAETMYTKLGPPVFVAHSETLREGVLYRLHADPAGGVEDKLRDLLRAHELMEGPLPKQEGSALDVPLPYGPGRSRLLVLLAADRHDMAMAQAERLAGRDTSAIDRLLAQAYADLAGRFLSRGRHTEQAFRWARDAARRDMSLPTAQYLLVVCYLERTADEPALTAANRFIDAVADRQAAYARLQLLEARWPGRPLWTSLRAAYPDYPPPPQPATAAASQPATDADSALPDDLPEAGEATTTQPAEE